MKSLPEDIKFRDLPNHFREHLSVFASFQIKSIIAGFTFIFLDLVIILPLLVPRVELILMITMPLLFFVNAWALRLLFKKTQETELESILFLGVLGVVGSICYFILVQKMVYVNLKFVSPMYSILSTLVYILFFYFQIKYQIDKYTLRDGQKKIEKPNHSATHKVMIAAPAAGYIAAQYFMGFSDYVASFFMSFVYLLATMLFIYIATKSLHKYSFMKKNIHLVKLSKTQKSKKQEII